MYLDAGRSGIGRVEFDEEFGEESLVCVDGVTYYNVTLAHKATGKLGTNGRCPGFPNSGYGCDLQTGRCDPISMRPDPQKPALGPEKQIKLNDIDLSPSEIGALQSLAMDPNIPIGTKIGTLFAMVINKGRGKLIPGGADNKAAFLKQLAEIKLDHPDFAKMVVGPGKTIPPAQKMAIQNFGAWVGQPATQEALYRVLVKPVSPPNFVGVEKQKSEAKALIGQLKAKGFSAQSASPDDSSLLKPVAYMAGAGLALYLFYRYTRKN